MIVVRANGDVALAAEYAFVLYMGFTLKLRPIFCYAAHANVHARRATTTLGEVGFIRGFRMHFGNEECDVIVNVPCDGPFAAGATMKCR